MDQARIQVEIERAKAERKNPLVLWLLNLLWPGLGNIVIGQTLAGILFGLGTWFFWGLSIITAGVGFFFLFPYWVLASAVGHQWINTRYSKALGKIEAKIAPPGGAA
jgi:TM2 domain-containing membrane protein YozV